jgi:hypothetical protein
MLDSEHLWCSERLGAYLRALLCYIHRLGSWNSSSLLPTHRHWPWNVSTMDKEVAKVLNIQNLFWKVVTIWDSWTSRRSEWKRKMGPQKKKNTQEGETRDKMWDVRMCLCLSVEIRLCTALHYSILHRRGAFRLSLTWVTHFIKQQFPPFWAQMLRQNDSASCLRK